MASGTNDSRAFTARLPADEYEALRALAFYTGTTMSDLLAKGVRMLLADQTRNHEIESVLDDARTRFQDTLHRLAPPGSDDS